MSDTNNLSQSTIKSDESPDLEGEEIPKLGEGKIDDELSPKLKVLIENNPVIEVSCYRIIKNVWQIFAH